MIYAPCVHADLLMRAHGIRYFFPLGGDLGKRRTTDAVPLAETKKQKFDLVAEPFLRGGPETTALAKHGKHGNDQFSDEESSGGGFRRKMERERHRGAKPLIDSPVERFLFHRWWRFRRIGTRRAFGGCAWRLSHPGETKTSVSR